MFVTHDQEEALELADRVAVLNHGVIEQEGTPEEVLEHPATPFVMSFLGTVNIFHGRVEAGRGIFGPLAVDYAVHADPVARAAAALHEAARVRRQPERRRAAACGRILEESTPAGAMVKLELAVPDGPAIRAELGRDQFERLGLQPGDRVYVVPRKVRVFVN